MFDAREAIPLPRGSIPIPIKKKLELGCFCQGYERLLCVIMQVFLLFISQMFTTRKYPGDEPSNSWICGSEETFRSCSRPSSTSPRTQRSFSNREDWKDYASNQMCRSAHTFNPKHIVLSVSHMFPHVYFRNNEYVAGNINIARHIFFFFYYCFWTNPSPVFLSYTHTHSHHVFPTHTLLGHRATLIAIKVYLQPVFIIFYIYFVIWGDRMFRHWGTNRQSTAALLSNQTVTCAEERSTEWEGDALWYDMMIVVQPPCLIQVPQFSIRKPDDLVPRLWATCWFSKHTWDEESQESCSEREEEMKTRVFSFNA